MRKVLVVVLGMVLGLLAAVPALAAVMDDSRAWFESIDDAGREGIQYDLTLLGHYSFLIDKQFGSGTFDALLSYQRSVGLPETGVLSAAERDALYEQSDVVYKRLGLNETRDELGRSSLVLPAALLTEVTAYDNGNSYATPDGGIILETLVTPSKTLSFSDLFASLNSSSSGFAITDASYNASRFVVSGKKNGREFYTMYQNADIESVGYSLSWDEAHAADASIIKIFIASYFVPLRFLVTEETTQKASSPGANAYGPWSLPADMPDVIALNGEIGDTLVTDWDKAIAARPDAKYLLLNSPGGYVDYALVVAHKVKDLGISTLVAPGMGCYSACSYIFFAGARREVDGELGVHQISAEVADLVLAQTTLSDVLDALDEFEVAQPIISVMLKTPPAEMYIFTSDEITKLGINRGDDIEIALADLPATQPSNPAANPSPEPVVKVTSGPAVVILGMMSNQADADSSLKYDTDRFAGVLGTAVPEVVQEAGPKGPLFKIRVTAASAENANAICSAIKSAGGGCYVAAAN